MEWQDWITIVAGIIAFGLWFAFKWQTAARLTLALLAALPFAAHLAYPDRYSDAMWLIGAFYAFGFQLVAVLVAAAIGWVAHLVVTYATWQGPGQEE